MEATSHDPQVRQRAADALDRRTFPARMAQPGFLGEFEKDLAPFRAQAARMARQRYEGLQRELQEASAAVLFLEGKMSLTRATAALESAREGR